VSVQTVQALHRSTSRRLGIANPPTVRSHSCTWRTAERDPYLELAIGTKEAGRVMISNMHPDHDPKES
jgi:hypothetical protein